MFGRMTPYSPALVQQIAPWTTIAACIVLAGGDIVLSAITPDYNVVEETTSQLMSPDAKYSELARMKLGLFAVLLVPFALTLPMRFEGKPRSGALSVTAIWVHIFAALISALATNDSDANVIGGVDANQIHDQAALVTFGAGIAVIVGYLLGFRSENRPVFYLTVAVLAILAVLGPVFVAELWTETNGVQERTIAWVILIWLGVTALSWRPERRTVASTPP